MSCCVSTAPCQDSRGQPLWVTVLQLTIQWDWGPAELGPDPFTSWLRNTATTHVIASLPHSAA